jgi:methyl-accepting chemotaxis protein
VICVNRDAQKGGGFVSLLDINGNDEITVLQNSVFRMMENLRGLVENSIRSFETIKSNHDKLRQGINNTSQAAVEISSSIRKLQVSQER